MVNRHKSLQLLASLFINAVLDKNVASISVKIEKSKVEDGDFVNFFSRE